MRGSTMRAAVYRQPGRVDIAEVAMPDTTQGAALVEIDYCGICGTDLHMMLDGWGTPGSVFGHEWSGRVVDPGGSSLPPGTTVVGLPSAECGACDRCRTGRTSLCRNRPGAGVSLDRGAFARYVSADPRRLVEVPDGVDARAAAYTEPLAVALHAVTLSGIASGDTAVVFGAGPIGAAIIAILRSRRIEVGAIEPGMRRADLATRLGASVLPPDDLDPPAHPGEVRPDAVDVVFETSGARVAAEAGLGRLDGGGTLVLVGTGLDHPRLDTNRIILNELRVTGAFNYDAGGFRAALDLIGGGHLPLDDLIEPETVDLDGLLPAMQQLRAGDLPGKVMVTP